jgi:ribosomal protein S18 acetylase RimI-like enzyme
MQQAAIVRSIATLGNAIGARASAHLDLAFRHMMQGQGAELGEHFLRLVTGEPHPLGNLAIVNEPGDLAIMRAAVDPLLTCGFPTAVLYPQGASDAVTRSLLASGYADAGTMPAMAVDIEHLAAPALPPGYEWARIGEGDEGRAWGDALAVGYGLPQGLARRMSPEHLGADMAPDASLQFFAIRRNGKAVATSMLYLADGLAGIYCVATLEEDRGKGLGAYATAEPLRAAQRQGYRVGVLQSSSAGHSVYLSLGFADIGNVPMFIRAPA